MLGAQGMSWELRDGAERDVPGAAGLTPENQLRFVLSKLRTHMLTSDRSSSAAGNATCCLFSGEGTAGPAEQPRITLVKFGAGSESIPKGRGQRVNAVVLPAQLRAQPFLVFTKPVPGSLFFPEHKSKRLGLYGRS